MRGSGDAADDYRVEEDAEFLFLPCDLVSPPRESEPAKFAVRCTGRDGVWDPAVTLDLVDGEYLPTVLESDSEARRIEAYVGAHDAGEQDVADLVVDGIGESTDFS